MANKVHTQIGVELARGRVVAVVAVALAIAFVAVDMFYLNPWQTRTRMAVGGGGAALLLLLARGDRKSLGLVLRPAQGFRYWIKITLICGAIVGGFSLLATGVLYLFDISVVYDQPILYSTERFWPVFFSAVLIAPVLEEPIYRLVLCAPLASTIGRIATIIISGSVFGLLHFVYDNPGPDNFIAGYVLGWAYMKSETLVIPIALHALGNLCVWFANVMHYYVYFGW